MAKNIFHPKYRPDIDGLRAIAVLSVVVFHFFPNWLTGGYAGVDVFFVISGFLISTILFQNLDKNQFSIIDFYYRRIRRIFPAFAVVLLSVLVFGWFCLFPDEFKQLGKHISSSAGFIQNFTLWKEVGYFDNASETKPLLHIWSLGIEEQFYFIWPLLLWGAAKFGTCNRSFGDRKLLYFLAMFFVFTISYMLNLNLIKTDPSKTFYLPQYRFFEMSIGGILAWIVLYKPRINISFLAQISIFFPAWASKERLKSLISIIGLVTLIIVFIRFNKETVFPGKMALVPIFATSLVIFAGQDSWINRNFLSNKVLVWFGLISFPLYLWHWPIFSFGRIIYDEMPSLGFRIFAFAVSIILSWLTVKYIEKPFRFGDSKLKLKVGCLTALIIIIGLLGKFIQKSNGLPFRFKAANTRRAIEYHQNIGRPTGAKIMLLGDSHAAHYVPGVKKIFGDKILADYTSSGCIPFYNVDRYDIQSIKGRCEKLMNEALKFFESNKTMTGIILSSMGPVYLDGTSFGNTDIARVTGLGVTLSTHPDISNRWEIYKIGMTDTLKKLSKLDKKILFILDIPELGFLVQECLQPRPFSPKKMRTDCFVSKEAFEARTKKFRKMVTDILKEFPNVKVFDPSSILCNEKICNAKNGENFIYRDGDHLSDYGSEYLVDKMKSDILELSRD